jgi:hypothetical protein
MMLTSLTIQVETLIALLPKYTLPSVKCVLISVSSFYPPVVVSKTIALFEFAEHFDGNYANNCAAAVQIWCKNSVQVAHYRNEPARDCWNQFSTTKNVTATAITRENCSEIFRSVLSIADLKSNPTIFNAKMEELGLNQQQKTHVQQEPMESQMQFGLLRSHRSASDISEMLTV